LQRERIVYVLTLFLISKYFISRVAEIRQQRIINSMYIVSDIDMQMMMIYKSRLYVMAYYPYYIYIDLRYRILEFESRLSYLKQNRYFQNRILNKI
jgi:hypothetical protein